MEKTTQNICLIDDDMIHVFTTKKMLQAIGFKGALSTFKNGLEAINALAEIKEEKDFPDVILLDINMPVMDGWGFLENFPSKVALHESCKIFMVSSSIDPLDQQKASGFTNVEVMITKPFTKDTIQQII